MQKPEAIFILSSLNPGGAEKVMSVLSNQASEMNITVHLILLSRKEKFHAIDKRVQLYEPNFALDKMPRICFAIKNFFWLRRTLKKIPVKRVLSFGGKYNAYVILANIGIDKNIFISDRSRPGISYGKFIDLLNLIVYRFSKGMIAQTNAASKFVYQKYGHKNIHVIPNPVELPVQRNTVSRQNIIINVGRFIPSKHQDWILGYFLEIKQLDWRLHFLGDGEGTNEVRRVAEKSDLAERIFFHGNVKTVGSWLQKASIFALTSTSEGFPNALAEAMAYGCACIAFDCVAGPSDMIDDGINGFLIPEGDHKKYIEKLKLLMFNEELRIRFGKAAEEKMKQFDACIITRQFLDFVGVDSESSKLIA